MLKAMLFRNNMKLFVNQFTEFPYLLYQTSIELIRQPSYSITMWVCMWNQLWF